MPMLLIQLVVNIIKFGLSLSDRMDQKAISNISYSKRWPKSKNSFSASYYSNNDLLIDEKTNPESRFYVNPSRSGTQLNLGNKRFQNSHLDMDKVIFFLHHQKIRDGLILLLGTTG